MDRLWVQVGPHLPPQPAARGMWWLFMNERSWLRSQEENINCICASTTACMVLGDTLQNCTFSKSLLKAWQLPKKVIFKEAHEDKHIKYLKWKGAVAAKTAQKCGAARRLTESTLSEWTHSSDTASEPRKTLPASSGKPPSPDESAAKTAKEEEQRSLSTVSS